MSDMEDDQWINYRHTYERPLSARENFIHRMKGVCTPIVSALGISTPAPLSGQIIKDVMQHLMNKHTLLRMCVRKNSEGARYFCKMDGDYMERISLQVRDDFNWETVVEECRVYNVIDTRNGPLWKCILLPNSHIDNGDEHRDDDADKMTQHCVLIFVQDHVINDGIGTMELMRDFMSILNETLKGQEVCIPISLPVLPQEYYINKMHPLSRFKRAMRSFGQNVISLTCTIKFLVWLVSSLQDVFIKYCGLEKERNPKCAVDNRVILQVMTKRDTRNLVQACKDNECTVQGAIQAAANVALLEILQEHGANIPIKWDTAVPVSMRNRLDDIPDNTAAGTYYGFLKIRCEFTRNPLVEPVTGKLWGLARNTTKVIQHELKEKQHIKNHYNLSMVSVLRNLEPDIIHSLCQSLTANLVCSLGNIPDFSKADDKAKPTGVLVSFTNFKGGPTFNTFAVTVDDRLSLTHTYTHHIAGEAFAEQYCGYLLRNLRRFIAEM